MTNPSAFGRRSPLTPSLPKGAVLGTFETYPEAQQLVDRLAKADFEVAKLSILGNDLKTVERVTGKLTWGRAAGAGAASGAYLGVFLGILLVLFSPTSGLGFVFAAVLIGAGFGMIFGLASYSINRRRHDYTSTSQVIATSYQVIIDPDQLLRAQELLGREASTD